MPDPNLLLGFDTADDAAVWQVDKDNAAVLTLDFFTPVVDDPYEFGAVAAANALSDVFAMGGKPVTALNILAFPSCMGTEVVGDVLRGGADKVREAGAFVVGTPSKTTSPSTAFPCSAWCTLSAWCETEGRSPVTRCTTRKRLARAS